MKTKVLISFALTPKLICIFVFAYAKSRFSHDAAHFLLFSQRTYPSNKVWVLGTTSAYITVFPSTLLVRFSRYTETLKFWHNESWANVTTGSNVSLTGSLTFVVNLRLWDPNFNTPSTSLFSIDFKKDSSRSCNTKYEPQREKTNALVSDQIDINQALQSQKMARGLKFRIKEVEGLYYLCSENKGANQLRNYRQADLHLCFAYAKSQFSHNEAQILCTIFPSSISPCR